jgi:hypothetical protein
MNQQRISQVNSAMRKVTGITKAASEFSAERFDLPLTLTLTLALTLTHGKNINGRCRHCESP